MEIISINRIAKLNALHQAFIDAGIPLDPIVPFKITRSRICAFITVEGDALAAQTLLDNFIDPEPSYDDKRKEEYLEAWTRSEFEEAFFEHYQGDSTKLNALLAKRDAIRTQYPKREEVNEKESP